MKSILSVYTCMMCTIFSIFNISDYNHICYVYLNLTRKLKMLELFVKTKLDAGM